MMNSSLRTFLCVLATLFIRATSFAQDTGSIVGWGAQVVGATLSGPYLKVAAGNTHSLGLKSDGSLVAWGNNESGNCSIPFPNRDFRDIAAGWSHTLALKTDGSILGWGSCNGGICQVPHPNSGFLAVAAGSDHSMGLKADGSIVVWGWEDWANHNIPQPNSGFVAIAAGYDHSLGLKEDGSIVAWGANYFGQCDVPLGTGGFVAIAAGGNHSLGLRADGSIVSWGLGSSGQCDVPEPNTGFVGIAAGYDHSLGLKASGAVVAWGWNHFGQCVVPSPNAGYVRVAAGGRHSLAIRADGSVAVWGLNWGGQCDVTVPNTRFVTMASGGRHNLGLLSNGSIAAWGYNESGECNVPAPNAGFSAVAAGGSHSLGLRSDGSVVAWGANYYGQCDVPMPNTGFYAIAAGSGHSLGLRTNGTIVGWGANGSGQCNVPAPNAGFVAISTRASHSLALRSDGSIAAWGSNVYGQCDVPAPNSGFVAVSAGSGHSLGLRANSTIAVWGRNDYGIWDIPFPNIDFVAIAAGQNHSLGLKRDGSIVAWEHNTFGQCNVPFPNSGFIGIVAGDTYSLGVRRDSDYDEVPDVVDNCIEYANPQQADCDNDGIGDTCAIARGLSSDCNGNTVPDACDVEGGVSPDCNSNGIPDDCDISDGTSPDSNSNGIPDECELPPVLSCAPRQQYGVPGGTVTVDLFVEGVQGLNAYQVQVNPALISGTGTLSFQSCTVDEARPDFVFQGLPATSTCNPALWQVTSVASNSATVNVLPGSPAYVGTLVFQVSGDAMGGSTFALNIQPEPSSLLLDLLSNTLPFEIAPACTVDVAVCDPPVVAAEGGRWLQVQLGPGSSNTPQAIRVTSPDCPELEVYADTNGCLVETPQFHTAAEWGTVHLTGDGLVPGFDYEVTSLCGIESYEGGTAAATTWRWGDVRPDDLVNVIDIQKVIQCAEGTFNPPTTVYNADLVPNCLAPGCDIFDVFAVLDAYLLLPYPNPVPCGALKSDPATEQAPESTATVELVANYSKCEAGEVLTVDAYVRNVSDLRGYQLELAVTGGTGGSLNCSDLLIDQARTDHVFFGEGTSWPFTNLPLCRLSSSLQQGGVTVGDEPAYLGTFVVQASGDAAGLYNLLLGGVGSASVLLNSSGQQLTFSATELARELALAHRPGDTDCDDDVDLQDYAAFASCLGGPDVVADPHRPSTAADCLGVLDLENDGDVDLADFAAFQMAFSEP